MYLYIFYVILTYLSFFHFPIILFVFVAGIFGGKTNRIIYITSFWIMQCTLYRPCWNALACINTVPGYQCLACPRGYKGNYEDGLGWNNTVRIFELMNQELSPLQDQMCIDIDECQTDNGGCDSLSPCVNTIVCYYMYISNRPFAHFDAFDPSVKYLSQELLPFKTGKRV